jgi:hypothetical protein
MRRSGLELAAGLFVTCLSCSDAETRPQPIADCNDQSCVEGRPGPLVPPGSNVPGVGAGSGGDSGSGGSGGMPSAPVGTLTGSIRSVARPDMTGARALSATLEVHAAGSATPEVKIESEAGGLFRLEKVRVDPGLWVGVGAFDDDLTGQFMDTLQRVDSSLAQPIGLLVVQRSVLEEISQGFMTPDLDPTRAYAVITFVDALGVGVRQIQVLFPAPEDVGVAYDAGDTYNDQLDATSTRGSVVLLNIPASAYPGGFTHVQARAQAPLRTLDFDIQVARGSVTLATISVLP